MDNRKGLGDAWIAVVLVGTFVAVCVGCAAAGSGEHPWRGIAAGLTTMAFVLLAGGVAEGIMRDCFGEAGRAERAAADRERVAKAMRREAAAQREIDVLLEEVERGAEKARERSGR